MSLRFICSPTIALNLCQTPKPKSFQAREWVSEFSVYFFLDQINMGGHTELLNLWLQGNYETILKLGKAKDHLYNPLSLLHIQYSH